jgi:hypothetical protein
MKYIILLLLCSRAYAFESWGSVDIAGYYYSDMKNEYTHIIDNDGKWLINAWDNECLTPANRCFAAYGGRLYFHGEKGDTGDGVLMVSKEIEFISSITVEAEMDVYCNGPCWANIGLYRGEGNYRAIGFNEIAEQSTVVWGPIAIAHIDKGHRRAVYKISYSFDGNRWRWDYFVNSKWIAGHFSEDYEYKMGLANFVDNKARIEIGFGGYINKAYSEGSIGKISVVVK